MYKEYDYIDNDKYDYIDNLSTSELFNHFSSKIDIIGTQLNELQKIRQVLEERFFLKTKGDKI